MGKTIFLLTLCVVAQVCADHGTLKGRCGRRNSTSDVPVVKPRPTHARTQSATLPAPLPVPMAEPVTTEEPKAVEAPQLLPESVPEPVPFVPMEAAGRVEGNERHTNKILKASLATICGAMVVGVGYQLITAVPQVALRAKAAAEVKKVAHKS